MNATDKELLKAWWKKALVNSPSTHSFDEYLEEDEEKYVFGVNLNESIQYANARIVYEQSNQTHTGVIPLIIAKCGSYLKSNALTVEGIFRISGNSKRITLLQNMFNHSKYNYGLTLDWTEFNVHDASTILRRYLNQLPEPIIRLKYQAYFKKVLEDDDLPNIENKVNAFQNLIGKLAVLNQYLLFYLLDLLYLFSLNSDSTRMDISSLSTAFTPCIFSDLSQSDTSIDMVEYNKSKNVLLFLIQHQDQFQLPTTKSADIRPASMSTTDLTTTTTQQQPPSSSLKRSKTMPTSHQASAVNQNERHLGRWKSIKLTVKS